MSGDLALFKQKEKKGALAEGRGAYNILQLAHFSFINFRAERAFCSKGNTAQFVICVLAPE
jgi:hypothetical protein